MVLTQAEYNKLEQFLDKIATAVVTNLDKFSDDPSMELLATQKTIRNGILQIGLENEEERKVIYQKELEANTDDILIQNSQADPSDTSLSLLNVLVDINGGNPITNDFNMNQVNVNVTNVDGVFQVVTTGNGITRYLNSLIQSDVPGGSGTLNISQFLSLKQIQTDINPEQAIEYLNTNIYELLPSRRLRQKRIDDFFKEYSVLKGFLPQWQQDITSGDLSTELQYSGSHDISQAQDAPDDYTGEIISEEQAYITRLDIDANEKNKSKTLQYLRDDLNNFLKDIDQEIEAEVEDERPTYTNKSKGFLKIRSLNQGIIIRKQEGDDVGLEQIISIPPYNQTNPIQGTYNGAVLDNTGGLITYKHPHHGEMGPSYLMDGFTITMWVKFLDRTSKGTLFNYGNPLRDYDPKGFVLETYVLNKDEVITTDEGTPENGNIPRTWGEYCNDIGLTTFANNDYARFIRLVVKDHKPYTEGGSKRLYDSRIGYPSMISNESLRLNNVVPELGLGGAGYQDDFEKGNEHYLVQHIQVPIDFNEWFFVVATYNPLNYDEPSYATNNIDVDPITGNYAYSEQEKIQYYWKNNFSPNVGAVPGFYTHYSGFGAKCKVEFISKKDLLRARGYAPEQE